MHHVFWALGMAPLALTASHASAQAAGTDPLAPEAQTAVAETGTQPAQQSALPTAVPAAQSQTADAASVMSLDDLKDMRGGTQTAINSQTIISQITGNTIEGDFTAGHVSFSDNALSGFNGLGNIVVNTGALSSLQATLGVTINTAE